MIDMTALLHYSIQSHIGYNLNWLYHHWSHILLYTDSHQDYFWYQRIHQDIGLHSFHHIHWYKHLSSTRLCMVCLRWNNLDYPLPYIVDVLEIHQKHNNPNQHYFFEYKHIQELV